MTIKCHNSVWFEIDYDLFIYFIKRDKGENVIIYKAPRGSMKFSKPQK